MILPPPSPEIAVAGRDAVRLLDAKGAEVRRIGIAARRVEWAPDGSTLAILATNGRLSILKRGGEPNLVAEGASEPVWGADGRLFFVLGTQGIAAALDGKATLAVPAAHSPAPSPDGARLAFATDGAQGGVWTAGADGAGARRLLRGTRVGEVSWSYDGRWLAAAVDGRLRLVRSNGAGARDLGETPGTAARWSLGAAELLARRGRAWSAFDYGSGAWADVDLDASVEPRWSGPRSLVGLKGGVPAQATVGGRTRRIAGGAALDAARATGLYRGASFPDRFRDAPPPASGRVAWKGRIASFDPVGGVVAMAVESEVDASGRETVLKAPATRRAKAPSGPLARRLAVLPESDAWLVVGRGRVVDAFLPDAAPVAESPARPAAGVGRAARPVEFDGVCRDRVTVPMVYPLPLARREPDTFLVSRGGGARRHHGNDLMAPKMTPLLATFDGTVSFARTGAANAGNMLTLTGDDGYVAWYLHVNNDTPGTDDGRGSARFAFPADLQPGDRVRAGEVVGWCGDSGNAEDAGSHLHFELHDGAAVLDPFFSLQAASRLTAPRYADPDPTLVPAPGEARWDGVAASVDLAKGVVVLDLTGEGAPPSRNLRPRFVYLRVAAGATLRYRGEGSPEYGLDAVRPGARISAVGPVEGSRMDVRAGSMALAAG